MRTLTTALNNALAAPVQRPAVLVQIAFASTLRMTSNATLSWNGSTWTSTPVSVDGLVVEALRVSGAIVVDNRDGVIGGLILGEGVQDRPISIWGYDAAATATADVVWLASCVGASAQVSATEARIALRHPCEFTSGPRTFVNAAAGFTNLLPAGAVLRINGIDMRLERR